MSEPKTILALDDSEIVLDVIRFELESAGYAVATALDVAELEAQLGRVRPSLVVLDVQMPEAFGDDVARVLQAVHELTVPILLFSSLDAADLARRASAAGLAGYVSKDDGVEALVARIATLLA